MNNTGSESEMRPEILFVLLILITILFSYTILLQTYVYLLRILETELGRFVDRPVRVRRFKRHPDRGPRTNKFMEYWDGEEARFVEAFRVSGLYNLNIGRL